MASSGIPGDLPVVFSFTKYWDSTWWTVYFPSTHGIKIDRMKDLESTESSAVGDSNKDSTEGSDLGKLRFPESPQGATGQDPHLQEVD